MAAECTATIYYENYFSYSKFEVSGHQGLYSAGIHGNGGVSGHQGPYFTQIQSINHDICKIRASVSGKLQENYFYIEIASPVSAQPKL